MINQLYGITVGLWSYTKLVFKGSLKMTLT